MPVPNFTAAHGRGVQILIEDVIAPVLREEGPLESDLPEVPEGEDPEGYIWEHGYEFLENVPAEKNDLTGMLFVKSSAVCSIPMMKRKKRQSRLRLPICR